MKRALPLPSREDAVEVLRRVFARYVDGQLGDNSTAEAFGAQVGALAAHPLPDILRKMLDGAPDLRARFEPVLATVILHDVTWVDVIAADMAASLAEGST